MIPNRFALAALGFTCVAAAAGGGYLASRQNAAVQPAEAGLEIFHAVHVRAGVQKRCFVPMTSIELQFGAHGLILDRFAAIRKG